MKLKMIAVAVATLSAGAAFAATTPVTCAPSTLAGMINTCAPEVTFYMGGASAQSPALTALLNTGADIFDTSAVRGVITDTATSVSGAGNTVGYIGLGAAGTPYAGKRVLVIYNKANGSAAGVNQLLTGKGGSLEEVTLVTSTVKNLAKGIRGTCVVATESTSGSLGTASCATEVEFKSAWGVDVQKTMHLALSDVRPSELSPGIIKKWDAAKFPSVTTGMQGFGVIVNPALYKALITKEVAAGRLAASCGTSETVGGSTDVITADCQPNLSKALYASIISGKVITADALLGTSGDTKKLVLARRVDSSGTQAASNIFFAGQPGYNVKTPTTDGFLALLPGATAAVGDLTVTAHSSTGGVITAVSGTTTDYALGVVSLENTYSMTKSSSKLKGALFVKVEGESPNFTAAGSLDSKHRAGLLGGYPFVYEMQAIKSASLAGNYLDIANKIIDGLKDPAQNLAGIAYIGSTDAAKNTTFTRNGNNYLPLVKN